MVRWRFDQHHSSWRFPVAQHLTRTTPYLAWLAIRSPPTTEAIVSSKESHRSTWKPCLPGRMAAEQLRRWLGTIYDCLIVFLIEPSHGPCPAELLHSPTSAASGYPVLRRPPLVSQMFPPHQREHTIISYFAYNLVNIFILTGPRAGSIFKIIYIEIAGTNVLLCSIKVYS